MNQSLRMLHNKGPVEILKTRVLTGVNRGIEMLQREGMGPAGSHHEGV